MNTITQAFLAEDKKSAWSSFLRIRNPLFVVLSLTLTTLFVYQSVFTHQFQMHWDDQWAIFNFYTENGLTAHNLYEIFTQYFYGQYAPVNQLAYTALYAAAGNTYNPLWFHSFSLLVHLSNVILTFYFIKKLLTASLNFENQSVFNIAYCTAFIMAIHPFLVESVAWMAASKVLIYSFFYLLSVNLYFTYLKERKIGYLVLVAVFFIFSFGAKEQAVTLPVCLLLIDYVLKRDLKSSRLWLEKLPFFLLSLLFGYVTFLSQKSHGVGVLTDIKGYPFYQNIIFGSYALTEYTVKCLIPVKLSFLYLFPNQVGYPVPLRFWMYPVVLVIVFVCLRDAFKNKWVLFSVVFFIVHLGVTLHIIPISRFSIVADRYAYLASIAMFFLIAYYFDKALQSTRFRSPAIVMLTLYIIYLGAYTHQHAKVWHDTTTLKKEVFDRINKQEKLNKAEKK